MSKTDNYGITTYFDEYEELKNKYKIARGLTKYNKETKERENINIEDYDIVIKEEMPRLWT